MPGLLLFLGISLAALWATATGYIAWMLTHPPRRTYGSAVARGRPGDPFELDQPRQFQSWWFESRGMRLPVWSFRGDAPPGAPTIILTHGWGDSRIGALARVPALVPLASLIIAWDLPGHGEAPGRCTLGLGEIEDLKALIRKTQIQRIEEMSPLVLFGWSLGAGLSIAAAMDTNEIAGVIAESPYRLPATPARNVLRAHHLPHRTNLVPALALVGGISGNPAFRGFDRAALASRVRCPLLVVCGEHDAISPVEDGRAVAAAAPRGTLAVVPGAGHNDLWTEPQNAEKAGDAVGAFLRSIASPTLKP